MAVMASSCPDDGLFVVQASANPAVSLRVEIARAPHPGFVHAGPWSLSPIGEYPAWEQTPAALRETFDRVVACVTTGSGPPIHLRGASTDSNLSGGPPGSVRSLTERRGGYPWLLALTGLSVVIARRGLRRARNTLRHGLVVFGAWVTVFVLRRLAVRPGFFHQNGQGPAWIGQIVTHRHHAYGPGFTELFGWTLRLAPDHPERAVFAWQGALAALGPLCAWSIARRMGAGVSIALALALGVAIDPSFARGAQSESYYTACASLLFLAVALVSSRTARAPVRSVPFVLTSVSAGLLIAQAARIQPVCWMAAALTPIAFFVATGSLRHRIVRTVAGTAVIAAVVAITSGFAMRTVILSEFGAQWLGRTRPDTLHGFWLRAWIPSLALVTAVGLSRRPFRAAWRALTVAAILGVMVATDIVASTGSPPWILAAYTHLYAPALCAALAGLLAGIPRTPVQERALGFALALALTVTAALSWPALNRRPTDTLELSHALAWRDTLPRGATVVSLDRAGYYILTLPIYSGFGTRGLDTLSLDLTAPPPDLRAYGSKVFYYRASICSTPVARAYCDAVEHRNPLVPVVTYALPAVPSMAHLTYDSSPVRVGLYRLGVP